jgi:hypothetical protein
MHIAAVYTKWDLKRNDIVDELNIKPVIDMFRIIRGNFRNM